MDKKSRSMMRRSYLAALGTMGAISGRVLGDTKGHGHGIKEIGNGVLISRPDGSGFSPKAVAAARKRALNPHLSNNDCVCLSDAESVLNRNPDSVAYYIGWDYEKGGPVERVWSKQGFADETRGRSIISGAKRTINKGNASSLTTHKQDGIRSDPGIDPSPDWQYQTTALSDRYAYITDLNGDNVTLGKVDLRTHIYRAPDSQGHYQFACIVDFMSYPGTWLDDHDSNTSNGKGLQKESVCKQDWTVGIKDYLDDVDYGPTSVDGGVDGCASIDSVEIGVDSSGPYGSITFDPSVGSAKIENISDPDETVETRYEYGGFFRDSVCGGARDVNGGNAGVFLWSGVSNMVQTSVKTDFEWDAPTGHILKDDAKPWLNFHSSEWT